MGKLRLFFKSLKLRLFIHFPHALKNIWPGNDVIQYSYILFLLVHLPKTYQTSQFIKLLFVVSQLMKRCRKPPSSILSGFITSSSGISFLLTLATLANCFIASSYLSFSRSHRIDSGTNL